MSSNRNRRFQSTQEREDEEDGLTSTQLKSKLIQVMKNRGILDSMKVNQNIGMRTKNENYFNKLI